MSKFDECVAFLRKLIQVPSLPGAEAELSEAVHAEMVRLGFDHVERDAAGNIVGLCRGCGRAPAMMFNTHLDHVDVGDSKEFPYGPFSGAIHEGRVWGRGAVDIKGPLAAQLYAVGTLSQRPAGDVYVSAVVQEEVGGLGARYLMRRRLPRLILIGEPSENQVKRGHRGRTELVLHVRGKSAHASVPQKGVNPLRVIARFIEKVDGSQGTDDPDLGPSSVACTLVRTDQTSPNVIPGQVWLTCDWRNVPAEPGDQIRLKLQRIAEECSIPGAEVKVSIPIFRRVSYTGLTDDIPADNPAYSHPADHPAVRAAHAVLTDCIPGLQPPGIWQFATDGGHFAQAGVAVVGFGPGDPYLAHTSQESISMEQLQVALRANQALAMGWALKAAEFGFDEE